MEPPDQTERDERQGGDPPQDRDQDRPPHEHPGSDPSREGQGAPRSRGPEAPQVIGTDAPLITRGPAVQSDWSGQPDRVMVVQTNRIREPSEAFHPGFVMVPVESERTAPDRSGGRNGEGKVNEGDQGKGGQDQEPGKSGKGDQGKDGRGRAEQGGDSPKVQSDSRHEPNGQQQGSGGVAKKWLGQSAQSPSPTRILLMAGVVSLVCGVVGAWGYSYFFGPDSSKDQGASSKSGSSKGGSSKKSGSSQGSESGKGSSDKDSGATEDSDARKNSTSTEQGSGAGKLVDAEVAWLAAVKELQQARDSEKSARQSEQEKQAILDFLKNTLLSAGRPGSVSLTEAFWTAGQGKDVTLRSAVDAAESQAAEAFEARPLAEACVREMLGLAYLSLGDAPQAVKDYRRALELREAMQGPNHPDTAACRNQLAIAYRLAGRADEGGRLYERDPNSPERAAALATRGAVLLREKKYAEAELKLRECLALRRKNQPEVWTTADTESILGDALLQQRKFAEAEPLLISGYEGLKQHENAIPAQDKSHILTALQRLVNLYVSWGKEEKAREWRKQLDATAIAKQT